MSKQDLKHIAIVLSHYESMGATAEELDNERKEMEVEPLVISHNLAMLGLI